MKEQVIGSLGLSFEEKWGHQTVRAHLDKEHILVAETFHLVWWKGLRKTCKGFPKMYCGWLTKEVSEFGGPNRRRAYWNIDVGT